MHKAFPLPKGTSYCLKMNATVKRIEMPLPEVCTAIEEKKKKLPRDQKLWNKLLTDYNGNKDGNIACVSTSSTIFPTTSVSVATISQDTTSAYIASQSNGSQIKFEDINQIDEDDMEEMDIKWNMALLSMRADKFWKRTGKKISIQKSDVAGFDKSKVKCFNCHKMGHFAGECKAPRSQEIGRKESHRQGSKAEEKTPKALMAIDGELEELKLEKDGLHGKLAGLLKASKNLNNLIESQRSDKVKEGVGYNVVPPPATDLYLSPKKDLSWTGLPKFVDDTITDYSRPSPTVASTSAEGQNKDSSTSEDVASPNTPKPFVKFVKHKDSQSESPEFVLKKKACYNCGDFSHLANDYRKKVQREISRSQNHAYMGPSHRSAGHKPHGAPIRPPHRSVGHRPHGPSINPIRPNMNGARPNRSFFIHAPSYETRPFPKSSAVKTQYRALWVPTVNRNNPSVNRKFSSGKRNFPTVNRKFPTASIKFTTGSIKIHTADMGKKGKAVKPSACWT
nr:hypothetical protein [Tanacetum cinerariifolium]